MEVAKLREQIDQQLLDQFKRRRPDDPAVQLRKTLVDELIHVLSNLMMKAAKSRTFAPRWKRRMSCRWMRPPPRHTWPGWKIRRRDLTSPSRNRATWPGFRPRGPTRSQFRQRMTVTTNGVCAAPGWGAARAARWVSLSKAGRAPRFGNCWTRPTLATCAFTCPTWTRTRRGARGIPRRCIRLKGALTACRVTTTSTTAFWR